jgi:hypothetical protein
VEGLGYGIQGLKSRVRSQRFMVKGLGSKV